MNEVTKVLFNQYKTLEELSCANINDLEKCEFLIPIEAFKCS